MTFARLLRFASLIALCCAALPALAQGAQEHEVKAAFLYRFLSFVEWPKEAFSRADSPIVIGFVGAEDMASHLEQVTAGRSAQNRPISVRRLRAGESLAGVHVLMVGSAERERIAALAKAAQAQGALLVADAEGGLDRGAAVNFLESDGRVRFEVSLDAAERSRLRISSRMLAVAQNVRGGR